ncbi:uncharacterized protein [Dermacentor andersoni]|uniref:uncharacterized protein n=1 Tax=Dermacentor andersoni TaxID=34620 RepID=UPI00241779AF|nr:uncharacterized protein LOC129386950 [Dermacentor andersoni]
MASTTAFPEDEGRTDYAQVMRGLVARAFASIPTSLRRKLLEADVRPECTAGLLRTLRGFQNLDPWALKLFDASGKYPTGLFGGTRADMGAFDECLSIVLRDGYGNMLSRGQYCNLMVYVTNGSAMEEMVQSFSDVLHPRLLYFRNYFSYTKLPLGRLAVCSLNDCNQQDMQALVAIGAVFAFIAAFSATSNTGMLLKVADKNKPDHYALQFLHGMRFYGIVHVALGHCGSVVSDTWSGLLNVFLLSDRWSFMIITAGFSSVDTFFFLRTCIPLFFIIMCLYALQPFVTGPNTKAFFQDLHKEVASHWWHLLLQIRNFDRISERDVIPHMWYLSTDFQLFVVSLVTLLIFKRIMVRTLNEYYIQPYYHAVCYFGGCMTYLVLDDFKERKISKVPLN